MHGYVTDLITDKALAWLEQRDSDAPFCLFRITSYNVCYTKLLRLLTPAMIGPSK